MTITKPNLEKVLAEIESKDFNYKAENGVSYNNVFEWAWIDRMKFCGCYSDENFKLCFELLFELYKGKLEDEAFYYKYKDVTEEFQLRQEAFLLFFDSIGWTEHGSSVRGCWLTQSGLDICEKVFK